jgi:hypothetical protein
MNLRDFSPAVDSNEVLTFEVPLVRIEEPMVSTSYVKHLEDQYGIKRAQLMLETIGDHADELEILEFLRGRL